jgi:uncharacterized protein (DUF488 family)
MGVYGFHKQNFFQSLVDAHVDFFCDIRLRRGMRGSEYAFVNSTSLQKQLQEIGIRYMHFKSLAPIQAIRDKQKQEDEQSGIAKRSRKVLGQTFIHEYEKECLSHFDISTFVEQLGEGTKVICLFCVEQRPEACHRSLVAKHLSDNLKLSIYHIIPPVLS